MRPACDPTGRPLGLTLSTSPTSNAPSPGAPIWPCAGHCDNGGDWRVGRYAIGATSYIGEDSENTNWKTGGQNTSGYFQQPTAGGLGNALFLSPPPGRAGNNNEGNYVVFSGLTASSFTLNAAADAWGSTPRAPINGIQVIGVVPEPGIAVLLGCIGLPWAARRRR